MRPDLYEELRSTLEADRLVALATVVAGPGLGEQRLLWPDGRRLGELTGAEIAAAAERLAQAGFSDFVSRRETVATAAGEAELFVEIHPPRPRLVVVGAVHVTVHLVDFARALGYETVVVDPRGVFATPERFSHADRLLRQWPDVALRELALNESSAVVVLTHDLKLDVPALTVALPSPARYVGALGSTKTQAKRAAKLLEAGLTQEQVDRLHAPIGLDLGGRRAEEIALSIIAQMVAVSHGRGGRS